MSGCRLVVGLRAARPLFGPRQLPPARPVAPVRRREVVVHRPMPFIRLDYDPADPLADFR